MEVEKNPPERFGWNNSLSLVHVYGQSEKPQNSHTHTNKIKTSIQKSTASVVGSI